MSNLQQQLNNACVLVLGAGLTGVSAARFASACGAWVRVADSRENPPTLAQLQQLCPQAEQHTGGFDTQLLDGVDHVVVSPGVALDEPVLAAARQKGLPICGDVEWFARCVKAPVIAITGSNGKSTVAAWLFEVAQQAGEKVVLGGNFGTPALDLLEAEASLYILELSSFQLDLVEQLDCIAATVLNISPDHIDRHGSLEAYANAKARIYRHAKYVLINADDSIVCQMPLPEHSEVESFGHTGDYHLIEGPKDQLQLSYKNDVLLDCAKLKLTGRHNYYNALTVWALARAAGIDEQAISSGLKSFAGLPHRCQFVAEINHVTWINDSKGTNLGALIASLAGTLTPVVLLAGGVAKGADFSPLADYAKDKVKAAIVFGQDASVIEQALKAVVAVQRVETLEQGVCQAAQIAEPGDTVLLSPGCASLDQFANYKQRGQVFMAAVGRLAA